MNKNQTERATVNFPTGPAYLIALLLLTLPPLDLVLGLGELQPDVLHWRFGVVGLLSGVVILPILGSFLAVAVAHSCDHVNIRRTLAVLNAVAALAFVAMLALFILDGLQLRQQVIPRARRTYDINLIKASFTLLLAMTSFGWLCLGSIRIALKSRTQREKRVPETRSDSLLVVAPVP